MLEDQITYKYSATYNTHLTNYNENRSNITKRGETNRITDDSVEGIMSSITEGFTRNTGHNISFLVQETDKSLKTVEIASTACTDKVDYTITFITNLIFNLIMNKCS
jgi:hypothetical protein